MVLALFCNPARTTPFPFSRATHSANALRRADPAFLPSSVPFHAPPARSKMAASTTWFVRPSMPNKCELRPAFRSTPLPPPPAQLTLVLAKRGKHHISFLVFFSADGKSKTILAAMASHLLLAGSSHLPTVLQCHRTGNRLFRTFAGPPSHVRGSSK